MGSTDAPIPESFTMTTIWLALVGDDTKFGENNETQSVSA